jgi:hypothetical protein
MLLKIIFHKRTSFPFLHEVLEACTNEPKPETTVVFQRENEHTSEAHSLGEEDENKLFQVVNFVQNIQ